MFNTKSLKKSHSIADQAGPMMESVSEQASEMTQRVVDAVRDSSQQLQEQAARASDSTAKYIRREPVKALLIAAASGAVLMALVSLIVRSRHRH